MCVELLFIQSENEDVRRCRESRVEATARWLVVLLWTLFASPTRGAKL